MSAFLPAEVIEGLNNNGLDVVRIGEPPWWMERVTSLPAELYRMKELV